MKKLNLWGLLLIFLSVYLFADMMGWLVGYPGLFTSGLSLVLVFVSLSNLRKLDWYGIIMPLALIVVLFADTLHVRGNTWYILLSGFLLATGLKILFKNKDSKPKYEYYSNSTSETFEEKSYTDKEDNGYQESKSKYDDKKYGKEDADNIRASAMFSAKPRYVRSANFTSAYLETNFGRLDVFFDDAQFNPDGSEIHIDCNFGAVNLFLPRNINIDNRVDVSLGSGGNQNYFYTEGAPTLVITGSVNLGALEIKYI